MGYGKSKDSSGSFRVDLKNFMARCESNYRRLYQVFPALATDQARRLGLSGSLGREVVLSVVERTPYTTLLSVEEQVLSVEKKVLSIEEQVTRDANSRGRDGKVPLLKNKSRWNKPPVLFVRMYHDARLAEVVSCDGLRSAVSKNAYPNKNMLQRDEKAQWNRFLEEWLMVCIARGHVADSVPALLSDDI